MGYMFFTPFLIHKGWPITKVKLRYNAVHFITQFTL